MKWKTWRSLLSEIKEEVQKRSETIVLKIDNSALRRENHGRLAMAIKMTEDEYQEHCDSDDGVCTNCGEIRYSNTEPDAENYPCDSCGEDAVQGIENALIDGTIEIVEED